MENNFKRKLFSMMHDLKETLDKGGNQMENIKENVDNVVQEDNAEIQNNTEAAEVVETTTEEVVETTDTVDTDDTTETVDATEPAESTEATFTQADLDAVKAEAADKYSQLNAQYEALKAEVESLREFKLAVDNQKKDELINSFYMLSDEDKADVIAHKTQYTYDEIESKLAVICVRNKVNFTEEKQEETKPVATFTCEEVDTTPAWLKAVQRTQAKNR